MRSRLVTSALFAITLAACQYEPGVGPAERVIAVDPAHQQEIEEWQARRTRSLTSETGWLTLTGLSWLQPGENTIGSAEGGDVPLPASTAASVGTILLDGDSMTLRAAPGAGVTVKGEPVTNVVMKPDVSGEPTIAEIGSVQFYTIERGGKLGVRVRDRQHPARTTFVGLEYFPTDPKWRVEARLEPYDPPKQIPILNIIGIVEPQPSPGALVFTIDGKEHRLDPILEQGSDELFIIFADRTSGVETYPAGRYLYAPIPPPGGTTVLDFNKSYNPPCAFTDFATCPLPPRQNRLDFRIEAGEKRYANEHHAPTKAVSS